MKAIFVFAIAALMLATPTLAGQKKKTGQTTQVAQSQAATSNNQTSVRHARLRVRNYAQPTNTSFSSY